MKTYTEKELYEIASVFYDTEAQRHPSIYIGLRPATGPSFYELPAATQKATVEGLKQRIEKETLPGYLERKKRQVGANIIQPIVDILEGEGLL